MGGVEETYVEDKYKPTSWLTLLGGERQTHFQAAISENAVYPRIGATVQIPKLKWVFRGFYGHYYQPPPLTSVSGPALEYANGTNTSFVALAGERDEEHQFGVQIPFHGWLLDADTFQTRANNFLDHSNIGESSIFIPGHRAGCAHPGLGDHAPLAAAMAIRAIPSRLFKPDRPADRPHHRRSHLLIPAIQPPAQLRPVIPRSTTISAIL